MLKLKYPNGEPAIPWPFAVSVVNELNRLERKIERLNLEMQVVMKKLGLIEYVQDD